MKENGKIKEEKFPFVDVRQTCMAVCQLTGFCTLQSILSFFLYFFFLGFLTVFLFAGSVTIIWMRECTAEGKDTYLQGGK